MTQLTARLVCEEEGQDLIEYSLLGALISVASILAVDLLGTEVSNIMNFVLGEVQDARN